MKILLCIIIMAFFLFMVPSGAWPRPSQENDPIIVWNEFERVCERGDLDKVKALLQYQPIKLDSYEPGARKPLVLAAQNGHAELCEFLIDRGADVNKGYLGSRYPLMLAVRGQYFETVKLLLDHAANPNKGGSSDWMPLHLAAQKGNKEICSLLLEKGAVVNARLSHTYETPLHLAAEEGYPEIVKLLIEYGADINSRTNINFTSLHFAAIRGHDTICSLLVEKGVATDIFIEAAIGKKDDFLKRLDKGPGSISTPIAVINDESAAPTVVHFAAAGGQNEILELLAEKKVNICPEYDKAETPLHYAAKFGRPETVRYLLDNGAPVDAMGNLNYPTPLEYAVGEGHRKVVELLLSRGADANAHTHYGPTPLSLAMDNDDLEMCRILIKHGADLYAPGAQGIEGYTLLHLARKGPVASLLIQSGADVNAKAGREKCWTPLLSASGNTEVMKVLIDNGADLHQTCEGANTLLLAAYNGNLPGCSLLLQKGLDVNYQAQKGTEWYYTAFTPLHAVAQQGHFEVTEFLISKGADVNSQNHNIHGSETPLAVAIRFKNIFTAEVIRKHGGLEK